jgi:hypothetical protein
MALGTWRYWRIRITSDNGAGFVDVTEIEFRDNGVDQATGGTASASSFLGGFPASTAFDNTASRWVSTGAHPTTIQYLFPGVRRCDAVSIHISNNGSNRSPNDFTIECSMNGTDWQIAHTVTNEPGWNNSAKVFSFIPPNRPELGNRIMITPDFMADV